MFKNLSLMNLNMSDILKIDVAIFISHFLEHLQQSSKN